MSDDSYTSRKHIDNYFSPGGIIRALSRDCRLQTHVEDESGNPLYLEPGDEICSTCSEQIPRDAFGTAPYGRVLASMKRKTGATYCGECYDPYGEDD